MFNHSSIFDSVFKRPLYSGHNTRSFQNSNWLVDRLQIETRLKVHTGCVNTLCWTKDSGSCAILSGSDDRRLVISDPFKRKQLVDIKTNHGDNIFGARFLPHTDDKKIVSCAGNGTVILTDLERIEETKTCVFNCASESGPVYECRPVSMDCSRVFLTCAEDGSVRRYDTRVCNGCCQNNRVNPFSRILSRLSGSGNRQHSCKKYTLITLRNTSTTSIDLAEGRNASELAVGCSDGKVRLYDMRNTKKAFALYSQSSNASRGLPPCNKCQVTCVRYNEKANELLVHFSGNQLKLLDPICIGNNSERLGCAVNLGTTTDETENENIKYGENEGRRVKRIRLRGDWTDTGPMARPNRESIQMIRRLNNVFNNLGLSPLSSSSPYSSSTTNSDEESSGDYAQAHLDILLESLVGRLSDQANDRNSTTVQRDRESPVSSEPDYDDDEEEEDDEGILNAQCHEVHDITASPSTISRHRNRRPPTTRNFPQLVIPLERFTLQQIRSFTGHRNSRTIIKECAFYGERYIMSGSDCGHLFVWNKETGEYCGIYLADEHVVNCVQPHWSLPIVATSGIDHDIKIWMPSSKQDNESNQDLELRRKEWNQVTERNTEMLRESQNTITVADPLLLGLLATISRTRRQRNASSPNQGESSTSGQ